MTSSSIPTVSLIICTISFAESETSSGFSTNTTVSSIPTVSFTTLIISLTISSESSGDKMIMVLSELSDWGIMFTVPMFSPVFSDEPGLTIIWPIIHGCTKQK